MRVCICLRKLNSYERMKGRMNVWKYVCNIEDVKRGSELSFFINYEFNLSRHPRIESLSRIMRRKSMFYFMLFFSFYFYGFLGNI